MAEPSLSNSTEDQAPPPRFLASVPGLRYYQRAGKTVWQCVTGLSVLLTLLELFLPNAPLILSLGPILLATSAVVACAYLCWALDPNSLQSDSNQPKRRFSPSTRRVGYVGLWLTAPLFFAAFSYQMEWLPSVYPQPITIAIAKLEGPPGDPYGVNAQVATHLNSRTYQHRQIKLVRLRTSLSSESTQRDVTAVAEDSKADLVIWGWYRVVDDEVKVTMRFDCTSERFIELARSVLNEFQHPDDEEISYAELNDVLSSNIKDPVIDAQPSFKWQLALAFDIELMTVYIDTALSLISALFEFTGDDSEAKGGLVTRNLFSHERNSAVDPASSWEDVFAGFDNLAIALRRADDTVFIHDGELSRECMLNFVDVALAGKDILMGRMDRSDAELLQAEREFAVSSNELMPVARTCDLYADQVLSLIHYALSIELEVQACTYCIERDTSHTKWDSLSLAHIDAAIDADSSMMWMVETKAWYLESRGDLLRALDFYNRAMRNYLRSPIASKEPPGISKLTWSSTEDPMWLEPAQMRTLDRTIFTLESLYPTGIFTREDSMALADSLAEVRRDVGWLLLEITDARSKLIAYVHGTDDPLVGEANGRAGFKVDTTRIDRDSLRSAWIDTLDIEGLTVQIELTPLLTPFLARKARELDPGLVEAYREEARAYAVNARYDKAIAVLDSFINLDLRRTLTERDLFDEEFLEEDLLNAEEERLHAFEDKIQLLNELGRTEDKLKTLHRLIDIALEMDRDLERDDLRSNAVSRVITSALLDRAYIYCDTGQHERELEDLDAILHRQPDHWLARSSRSRTYHELGLYQKELKDISWLIRAARNRFPEGLPYFYSDYYERRAEAHRLLGKSSAARRDSLQAMRLDEQPI